MAKLDLWSSLLTFGRVGVNSTLLSLNRSLPPSVSSGIDYIWFVSFRLTTINGRNGMVSREIATLCKVNYKLITDEKSNHIGTNANGVGSQCVRRKNIGSLSFRERYLSLRKAKAQSFEKQRVAFCVMELHPFSHPLLLLISK